jgi:hypothetical protein
MAPPQVDDRFPLIWGMKFTLVIWGMKFTLVIWGMKFTLARGRMVTLR